METTQTAENPPYGNLITTIPGRMLKLLMNPVRFFSKEMPKGGGYLEPLVFMVVMASATALVLTVTALLGFGSAGMMGMGLVGVILLPIMAAIFGFVGAVVLYVIWKLMGSKENFETAYRCMAFGYAYAPVAALLSGVPYLGTLLSSLWPMALMAIASIHVHGRGSTASWAVFGILGLLVAFMGLGGEKAGREMEGSIEGWTRQMEQKYSNPDEMTPEQAGKVLGEMLKGFKQEHE
jgi:hypothetical protein